MKVGKGQPVSRREEQTRRPRVRPERGGPAHVELIVVGRELLRGRIADGNSPNLAAIIARRGGIVHRITVVDDRARAIAEALLEALGRDPHLVILSGGLGPAPDDRTLDAVADALQLPRVLNQQARAMVEQSYGRLCRSGIVDTASMTHSRQRLCELPVGSVPLANEVGVAPGMLYRLPGGTVVVCLPGRPEEARSIFESALPLLRELAPRGDTARRTIESPTADEAELRPLIEQLAKEFPGVWISSRPPAARTRGQRAVITLEARASTIEEAQATLGQVERRLLALVSGSR